MSSQNALRIPLEIDVLDCVLCGRSKSERPFARDWYQLTLAGCHPDSRWSC
ncbi:hypothetical protein RBWH47_01706 [Rhodopirellula baltica WH47]|uniref:Uncharacterized protein n=1 Tax=Rhodopirellula baltica WH47 TaxID=991778 RepID=F2AV53_RHOBT|nr:hypothetical protein RBWH47_01706 [Rhodopirellula baltica WH47]